MIMVSIIMPVYNSCQYLEIAIKSIIDQTYRNFELILIDDGSTDCSGKICDKLAKNNCNIRVFHTENQGVTSARNLGLINSKGKYIAFCDNDDTYNDTLLEENIKIALQTDADIVRFFRSRIEIDQTGRILNAEKFPDGITLYYDFRETNPESYMDFLLNSKSLGVWNALYKKEFLKQNDIKFDVRLKDFSEDCCFNFMCYKYMKKAVVNQRTYYNWYQRFGHSQSRIITDRILRERITADKILLQYEYDVLKERYGMNIPKSIWTFHINMIMKNISTIIEKFELSAENTMDIWHEIMKAIKELNNKDIEDTFLDENNKAIYNRYMG